MRKPEIIRYKSKETMPNNFTCYFKEKNEKIRIEMNENSRIE